MPTAVLPPSAEPVATVSLPFCSVSPKSASIGPPPRRRSTRWSVDSFWML